MNLRKTVNVNPRTAVNVLLTVLGFAILTYLSIFEISGYNFGLISNSDLISIPYLYQDLFVHGGSFTQWTFPTTMCFFPDMFVYFILALIFKNSMTAIVGFIVFQFLLYFILIVLLGRKIIEDNQSICLFVLSAFITFFLYAAGDLHQNIFFATMFCGHFGAALMFLLSSLLVINSFSSKSFWNYVFLALICFLTIISDVLFLSQFVATALVSLVLLLLLSETDKRKIYTKLIAVISISSILGYIFFDHAKILLHLHITKDRPLIKRYHFHDLVLATKAIITKLGIFYQDNSIVLLLCFIFFGISLVFIIKLILQRFKNNRLSNKDIPFVFMISMLFISIVGGIFSQIFLDNNLMTSDPSLRHFQTFILFPVFLGLPLFLAHYTNVGTFITKHYISILLSLLICALIFDQTMPATNFINYHPPEAACIDQFATEYHLQNGVSGYWDAKLMSFLSKNNVNIVAITQPQTAFVPYIWFNTINSYINKQFNFVVVHNQPNPQNNPNLFPDPTDTIKANGQPTKILLCPDQANNPIAIYLYPNGVIDKTWNAAKLSV